VAFRRTSAPSEIEGVEVVGALEELLGVRIMSSLPRPTAGRVTYRPAGSPAMKPARICSTSREAS